MSDELNDCPECGNSYLAIRTDIYKDAREFVYCDCCGCLADKSVWNRIAAPVSAPLDTQALPPPIGQIRTDIERTNAIWIGPLPPHGANLHTADQMRQAIAPYAERIAQLERELAERKPVSIEEDNRFQCLLYHYVAARWHLAEGKISVDEATDAFRELIAYIDGRTAGTAQPGPWKVLSEGDKPDAARLLDVILTNGVLLEGAQYSKIDWTQVGDWRYSAAALSPQSKQEEAE